jgi:excisionase family DNA binding protein
MTTSETDEVRNLTPAEIEDACIAIKILDGIGTLAEAATFYMQKQQRLTVKEAAAKLAVSQSKVIQMARDNRLPYTLEGRRFRFSAKDLNAYIKQRARQVYLKQEASKPKEKPPGLTAKEVAERLQVSPTAIYKLARENLLPHIRDGMRPLRFSEKELYAFVQSTKSGPREKIDQPPGAKRVSDLLTVKEVAGRLLVSGSMMYKMCREGRMRHIRVRSLLRFRAEDIDAYVKRRTFRQWNRRTHEWENAETASPTAELMTVGEVAGHFRISPSAVYKMTRDSRIRHIRVASQLRFNKADIDAILESGEVRPKPS